MFDRDQGERVASAARVAPATVRLVSKPAQWAVMILVAIAIAAAAILLAGPRADTVPTRERGSDLPAGVPASRAPWPGDWQLYSPYTR